MVLLVTAEGRDWGSPERGLFLCKRQHPKYLALKEKTKQQTQQRQALRAAEGEGEAADE